MATAAYEAVVSLMHVLHQIQHPVWHRLHLDRNRVESLHEDVSFLQDFLEIHSQIFSKDTKYLARHIAVVADEAEDIMEGHVVDQLREGSAYKSDKGLLLFCQGIDTVIENFDSIKKELMMIKEGMALQEQEPKVSNRASSSKPPSIGKNTMVGFGEQLARIVEELIGDKSGLQAIPIVGMGGIGKTTLARTAFDARYMVQHFDIRSWVTISQEHSMKKILLGLLSDEEIRDDKNKESDESLGQLGEQLYKKLYDRRYLIVMDDVWSTDVWNDLRSFFPENGNGSRIMVTTRLSNVATSLGYQKPYLMDFLDDDKSWELFCKNAFKEDLCPFELEEIGKNIAKSCRELPLAIVVTSGLLLNSNMTREYWEFVAKNVNSFTNSENDDHCLKILSLSYNHLPIHLKPCFLYMRLFPEDEEIQVSKLVKLWVAEGFLKPTNGKSLEEVGEQYLKDLIDRNLILICKWMRRGKMKKCGIHDLLRDLCLGESQKEHSFRIPKLRKTDPRHYENTCFLCARWNMSTRMYFRQILVTSQRRPSLVSCSMCDYCRFEHPELLNRLRVVRAIDALTSESVNDELSGEFVQPTKLRYFHLKSWSEFKFEFTSIQLLWNLQTLVIHGSNNVNKLVVLPSEIWEMPHLRNLVMDEAVLSDPPVRTDSTVVLENLQTLSTILNFRCSEEVLERILNLKKLRIHYHKVGNTEWSYYCLDNLGHLLKLESLYLEWEVFTLKKMVFPHSLRKLVLTGCRIPWEEITIIGSLPNLEVLKLYFNAFEGPEWNPVEGQFLELKLLFIDGRDLELWGVKKIHFPNLESLVLRFVPHLEEIPLDFGEIETLCLIDLSYCGESVVKSAKEILEEQESLGNEGLQLHVFPILDRPNSF